MPISSDMTPGRSLSCGLFLVRELTYAAGYRQAEHAHSMMSVTLVLAGAIRERACSREELGSALSVVVKPAGVEHSDEVGPHGARTLQLVFDADAARELVGEAPDLSEWRWLHAPRAAAGLLSLLRAVRRPDPGPPGALEDHVVDALSGLPAPPAPARGEPPGWLRRVREALDDEIGGRRSVRELAHAAGTHPVSLSRAFARHFGCTITEYRRRERLRRAAAAIEGTGHDLSRIAHASGYADHPHLCREFRGMAGVTPSDFRAVAAGG